MNPVIIHSEDSYIVINKPAGMIVNNADTSRDLYTVQDWVIENFKLKKDHDSEFERRGGIVHRLDKETSGALVIALNSEAFEFIQGQFKDRKVSKEYIALCHGKMIKEGEINVPIGRLPWNRTRFGVIPKGRESYTKFESTKHYMLHDNKRSEELTLLRVMPLTGRTHQIRVHLQYAGHPIFADSLYGGRKNFRDDKKFLSRHFLHASKVSFVSPSTKKRVEYFAPLSSDLSSFLKLLTVRT